MEGCLKKKNFKYTGGENLEAMTEAKNYNDYLISIIKSVIRNINRKKLKVLDFGAGSGTYADMLKKCDAEIDCLEPDLLLQKKLKKKGFRVYNDIAELKQNTYDVIYSLNVFEHIEKDVVIIQILKNTLKKRGRIIIYVPAFQILYSAMDKRVGHYRRYKKNRLAVMADAAGLEIETLKYCDPLGFGVALLYKLIGNKDGVLSTKSVKFYDRFVFPASKLIEPVTSRFVGKNALLIAKPKNRR